MTNLRNVRTDYLQIAQKSFTRKLKLVLSIQVTIWLSKFAYHYDCFGWILRLQLIQNLARDRSQAVCVLPSEVALFYWNLSRRPFLEQMVNLDPLLCTALDWEHADLFLCLIFTQIPTND